MSGTDALQGSFTPLVTPFDTDGNIDLKTYEAMVERQITEGSHGIVVAGTTGEPSLLSVPERQSLAECALDVAQGRIPVMVATGSQSLAETIELTSHADRVGAAAVLIVTPYYIRPPQRGLVEYFAVAAAYTEKPMLVYHIPGRAGVDVTIDTLARLQERIPNFVGIKHASADLGLISDALSRLGADFKIFVGLEELSLPMLALGAVGMVNAVGNIVPNTLVRLCDAARAGDLAEARRLHYELLELNRSVFFETNPIPIKYMMKRLGVLDDNRHRLPMVPASPEVEVRLDAVLANAGLV